MSRTCCSIYFLLLAPLTWATESGIVGGRVAKAHSRPYMASLQIQGHHTCGGILIREDYILTAAHCKNPQAITVVLGAQDISKNEKSQQKIPVEKYIQHQHYNGLDCDIMLLKLKRNATINKYVKPIGIPRKGGKIPANIKCAVAGWGRTAANGPVSNVLKEATEKIQFNSECKRKWEKNFHSQHMICTKFDRKNGGICQGDSGGPLICNKRPEGITSFTKTDDCSDPKYPHVFTKINAFALWIKKMMQE
ncbi:mast cell protease 1A-like [Melanotaenia boesemani]|uniref:mast cell protease 1A-like n=1 Tax=Melanotaenia boesemani TaxID=1250792 RepID=UPI001C03B0AB|nr:mast cell protease 1A-like [Melanotaenia boesemani]